MKVSSKNKGMHDFTEDQGYFENFEEHAHELDRLYDENWQREKDWEAQGPINFEKLRELQKDGQASGTNYIGERVAYLREVSNMQPVDVYSSAGISKTTLYRIEEGRNIPTMKVFGKVLFALSTSLADFSCFPGDFEKWKSVITETEGTVNIYKYRNDILKDLENCIFVYKVSGKKVRFPRKHFLVLKKMIESSFAVLDLQPHDEEQ